LEKGLDLLLAEVNDPGKEYLSDDHLRYLELIAMVYGKLVMERPNARERYLKAEIEVHQRFLDHPYSYLDPHGRIDAEFRIKHLYEYLREWPDEARGDHPA